MAVSFRFDFAKARAALLYLASQNLPGFDKGKACKLLFLADKLHLVRYSRPITGDRYWALEHGPVPSRLLVLLNQIEAQKITDKEAHELAEGLGLDRAYVNPRLQARQRPDMDELSQSDVEALNRIAVTRGAKTFAELRVLTHETVAYRRAWAKKPAKKGSLPMAFEDFFRKTLTRSWALGMR